MSDSSFLPLHRIATHVDTVRKQVESRESMAEQRRYMDSSAALKCPVVSDVVPRYDDRVGYWCEVRSENVVRNMLSADLRRRFVAGNNIPLRSLSEMVLLAFSSMGGKIKKEIEKAFIFVPKSFRGIEPEPETIMLTSKGQIFGLAGFDYDMAAKVLNRLGVRTHVVTLSEVHTENSGSCSIDMARTWMQIVEGQKVRSCPFPELVREMLQQRSYKNISDFKNKSVVFEGISLALGG